MWIQVNGMVRFALSSDMIKCSDENGDTIRADGSSDRAAQLLSNHEYAERSSGSSFKLRSTAWFGDATGSRSSSAIPTSRRGEGRADGFTVVVGLLRTTSHC